MSKIKLKKIIHQKQGRPKKGLPKNIYIYFVDWDLKLFKIGTVLITRRNLSDEKIRDLAHCNFYNNPESFPDVLAMGDIVARRGKKVSQNKSDNSGRIKFCRKKWVTYYCGSYPRVSPEHKGKGLGSVLYRAMLKLAAIHNKKHRRKKLFFCPEECEAILGYTKSDAFNCYLSLIRRGYLRNLTRTYRSSREHTVSDIYESIRAPDIKATMIKAA